MSCVSLFVCVFFLRVYRPRYLIQINERMNILLLVNRILANGMHEIAKDYSYSDRPPHTNSLYVTVITAVKSTTPTLTHVIPSQGGYNVSAVTSLGDDVFVARLYSQQVAVYDAVTLTLQRRLTVPGLGKWPYGLAACPNNN